MPSDSADLQRQIQDFTKKLNKLGVNLTPMITAEINTALNAMVNNAKMNHYFIGAGRKTKERLEVDPELTNADGSLRFKTRTANLLNSITREGAKMEESGVITGYFIAGMNYARHVEYGTAKSRAFPFMRPAFEIVKPWFMNNLHVRLKNLIDKIGG